MARLFPTVLKTDQVLGRPQRIGQGAVAGAGSFLMIWLLGQATGVMSQSMTFLSRPKVLDGAVYSCRRCVWLMS